MKVTMILTNGFSPDVRVYKEALHLRNKGIDVEILCWDRNPADRNSSYELIDGIKVRRYLIPSKAGTGSRQIFMYLKFVKSVSKRLKEDKPNIVHCHDFDGVICFILSHIHDVPYIFDMHEYYENGGCIKSKIIREITLKAIGRSNYSLYENDIYLSKPYNRYIKKLRSLKNYPDSNMVSNQTKIKSDIFRIAYHGAVRQQIKQFSALFEAVKDLPNVRVDVNGGGIDYEELKEIAQRYKNVHINGPYDGTKETSKLYAESDVIFCGYDKSVPNYQKCAEAVKFYESIVTGTPMIMEKYIGMGDKVEKYGYGIAADTSDVKSIRDAIVKLKDNKEFWDNCRTNELRDAGKYVWDNEVKVLDEIYLL